VLKYEITYAAGEGAPKTETVECDFVQPPVEDNGCQIQFYVAAASGQADRLVKQVNPSAIIKMDLVQGVEAKNVFDQVFDGEDPLAAEAFGFDDKREQLRSE